MEKVRFFRKVLFEKSTRTPTRPNPPIFSDFSDISSPSLSVVSRSMTWKKWIIAAASMAMARRFPVLWTAMFFGAVPLLMRSASSLVAGGLSLQWGATNFAAEPFIGSAAFVPGAIGFLKYSSRDHVLAYGLWVVTFLSVAIVGIVMLEAFSPPREWSGSLALPGLIICNCCAGALVGGFVLRIRWYRRRIGRVAGR
jgi:hypothetical protein